MAFSNIPITQPSAVTYNSAGTGRYVNANVTFGGPTDYFLLAPSRKVKGKTGVVSTSVMKYAEVAPLVAGDPNPYYRITIQVECHKDMALSNVDGAFTQINEFISVANLTRLFNGEV